MLALGRSLYHSETGPLARNVSGLNTLRGPDTVEINHEDASALEIQEGDVVNVISRHGETTARARVTGRSPKGAVFMAFPLVSDQTSLLNDPVVDPAFGLPRYMPCTVRIEKRRT